ncbi:hypothetical protein KR222_005749, partial [Zaprionus bogoriensis]
CHFETQTWGIPNVNDFGFCLNGRARYTQCNENHYYVDNEEMSGCIPVESMDPNCVNSDVTVGACTGINLKQPQESEVLTNFWLCTAENAEPIELSCLDDKAFLNKDGYLGCFDWTWWRELRGCETY